jgi:hypothetical protein
MESCCEAVEIEMLLLDVLFDEAEAMLYISMLNSPDLSLMTIYHVRTRS